MKEGRKEHTFISISVTVSLAALNTRNRIYRPVTRFTLAEELPFVGN